MLPIPRCRYYCFSQRDRARCTARPVLNRQSHRCRSLQSPQRLPCSPTPSLHLAAPTLPPPAAAVPMLPTKPAKTSLDFLAPYVWIDLAVREGRFHRRWDCL
ncbi:uncharacterized protein PV07_08493 [Cladophialophora immunda]|uniref:Uncharacterized protein n=1 Tax=Cladophialophora immunda TaxID=569365 RepID=A0A0D2C472_9EURO|nr:uncharacterized protein PV07_08493 [Cladophialophora immunda]KIW25305.1 hypothetical protein PV07_08493 [Cladophialophora immunda]